ncbi:MAG TPA: hypothetical protein ENO05_05935 [Bacteroides sp.]|nr:hypothetical protein [Bacteroides sp.]
MSRLLSVFVLFQLLSGCLMVPGKLVPTVHTLPDRSAYENKPDVFIDLNFHTFLSGKHSAPVENITAKDQFLNIVRNVTDRSNLFESYTFDRFEGSDKDLTIQMDMMNTGNNTGAMLAGCVSGLTLTVIPVAVKDNYVLTATLLDSSGTELATYRYENYVRTWIHMFLFPFFGTMKKVPGEVMENMVRNLYNDILQDGYLKYAYQENELPDFLCLK